jgi:subtilisin family serine protease
MYTTFDGVSRRKAGIVLTRSVLRTRWLIGLTALVVLVSLVAAGLASAGGTAWQRKVDASVLTRAEAGNTGFLVYLEDQADLSGAYALDTKRAKGRYVYERLTSMARKTQAPLLARLDDLDVRHESFWVTNAIWVAGRVNAVQAMAQRPEVEHVYAMGRGRLDMPAGAQATRGANLALGVGNNISHVNADDVWALGYTGQGVVVASADTGVEWTHPALKAKYRGWNGSTANHDYNWHDGNPNPVNTPCPGPSPEPCDDDELLGGGHGTHTTGTMVGDDGAGNRIGMAPGAKWIGCRNMNNGVGVIPTYLSCMQWFIAPTKIDGSAPNSAKAPDVINNSWGCVEVCPPPALQDTLQASRAAGIFYAVSAGNDGLGAPPPAAGCSTLQNPLARYPEAFTVGATYIGTDAIAEFSSRGPVLGDPTAPLGLMKPNISAPGVDVRSSLRGGGYGLLSGTSMAGPHVAGLVALIISANPSLRGNVDKIEDIIEQTAVRLTTNEGCGGDTLTQVPNNTFGWGRIDALAAVRKALPPPGAKGDSATGGGWLADTNGGKLNFGFTVKRKGTGVDASLQLNDKAAGVKIHLTQATSLGAVSAPCGDVPESATSLQFRGTGTFNGTGASFRVCVQDNGEGSHAAGKDRFYLECTAGCSYNTGARTPDDAIDCGNIQVRRTTPVSGGSTAPQPAGAPQPSVLVLDPLLATAAVAGQAQVLTVNVYDQYQAPLANAGVTLTRTSSGGLVETLTGVTSATGTVTFTALNLAQATEYIARAGAVQSNAIEIAPPGAA